MLTLKARYAVATLISLARSDENEFVSLASLCARQGISPQTVAPVMQCLSRARLIKGRRGPKGGYKLLRRLEEISLEQAVVAVEGRPTSFIASWFDGNHAPSKSLNLRVTDESFQALDQAVAHLETTSTEDVIHGTYRFTNE